MTKICPRCSGNGYIKIIKGVEWPSRSEEIVAQCPMCNSKGEVMLDEGRVKSLEMEKKLLTIQHIKKLENEISRLMKQKAELQDQVDKYVDKELKK